MFLHLTSLEYAFIGLLKLVFFFWYYRWLPIDKVDIPSLDSKRHYVLYYPSTKLNFTTFFPVLFFTMFYDVDTKNSPSANTYRWHNEKYVFFASNLFFSPAAEFHRLWIRTFRQNFLNSRYALRCGANWKTKLSTRSTLPYNNTPTHRRF